jgi:hypothetical protein
VKREIRRKKIEFKKKKTEKKTKGTYGILWYGFTILHTSQGEKFNKYNGLKIERLCASPQ